MNLEGIVSQADRCALPLRAVESLAEVEEPGERGGAARARGGLGQALAALRRTT